jgi:TetR/AcrR family transcriptional regulator
MARDPSGTRARILRSALAEFAAYGFAGARVDAIARRAGTRPAMLYHHFGSKEGLYRAVLRAKLTERTMEDVSPAVPVPAFLYGFYVYNATDPDWVRMLQWEALSLEPGEAALDEQERRRFYDTTVAWARRAQRDGRFPSDLDPAFAMLALNALATFPLAFRQVTRFLTGEDPEDAGFQERWAQFLAQLAGRIAGQEADTAQLELARVAGEAAGSQLADEGASPDADAETG